MQGTNCNFYVDKHNFMAALIYKIENEPYYSDVAIDCDALNLLPPRSTNISDLLHIIEALIHFTNEPMTTVEIVVDEEANLQDFSSFIPLMPIPPQES